MFRVVKRTGEVVMGIIGIVLSALFSIIGIVTNRSIDDPMVMQEMEKMMESDPAITAQDTSFILGIAESMGWYLILIGVIASILGLVAVLTIVKNRKPILSGIMFILAALVIGVGTIGFGFIPGLLFLIAGIMAFVRKPKQSETVY
jgi:predicted transcriptional regulator